MQEEVENRTLTLVVSGTKFTGRLLKAAISKYMAHCKEKKLQKQRSRDAPVTPHGKQTVKQLIGQNQGISNIRSGAWSAQHGNCSAWCGCAYYLFPAEWCDFAGYGIFD